MNTPQKTNNLGNFYTNLGSNVKNSLTNISKNAAKNISNSKSTNSIFNMLRNTNTSVSASSSPSPSPSSSAPVNEWIGPFMIFVLIAGIAIYFIFTYQKQITAGIHNIIQQIRGIFNQSTSPLSDASKTPSADVTDVPTSPQADALKASNSATANKNANNLINKLLPLNNTQVFNVSKNEFSYYDAQPLCQALGAELATYDQVKAAWDKGADWCNYGWVKGQSAVYPTQESTWKNLQSGPDEEKASCGVPGLNGGYFDNPEMKFGVNCYGVKPGQSEHDEEMLMKQGSIPKSVPALEVDKKVQEFKKQADNLGIMPFNEQKWSD